MNIQDLQNAMATNGFNRNQSPSEIAKLKLEEMIKKKFKYLLVHLNTKNQISHTEIKKNGESLHTFIDFNKGLIQFEIKKNSSLPVKRQYSFKEYLESI